MIKFITLGLIGLIFVLIILLVYEISKQNRHISRSKTQKPYHRAQNNAQHAQNTVTPRSYIVLGAASLSFTIASSIGLSSTAAIVVVVFTTALVAQLSADKSSQQKQDQTYDREQRVRNVTAKQASSSGSGGKRTLPDQHPLRIRLIAMVGGNIDTANRLLRQAQINNPGMPTEWLFEKVIDDLIRDRR